MEDTLEGATDIDELQCDGEDQDFVEISVETDENPFAVDENLPMSLEQQQVEQQQEESLDQQELVGEELLPEPPQLIGESLIPDSQIIDADHGLPPFEAENQFEMKPLLLKNDLDPGNISPLAATEKETIPAQPFMRSRKKPGIGSQTAEHEEVMDDYTKRSCLRKNFCGQKNNYNPIETDDQQNVSGGPAAAMGCGRIRRFCHATSQHYLVRTTVSVMNLLARILLWTSFLAMVVAVVWYSRELKMKGKDPHLIAWFSAGAFVLLGFPISMCGIFMHLTNYYQPNVQCYVVRILWMVPIYSIESWLW